MRLTSVLVLLLSLVLCHGASAQYYESGIRERIPLAPELSVKWVPTQLISNFPTYMLALEHSLKDSINLEYSVGSMFSSDFGNNRKVYFEDLSGIKFAAAVRRYVEIDNPAFNTYYGLQLFYNYANFQRTRTFEINCPTGGCSFFQNHSYQMQENQLGIRALSGLVAQVFGNLFAELEIGMGLRNFNSITTGKLANYEFQYGRDIREDAAGVELDMNLSLKISYWFK